MRHNKITFVDRPRIKPEEERPYANTLISNLALLFFDILCITNQLFTEPLFSPTIPNLIVFTVKAIQKYLHRRN